MTEVLVLLVVFCINMFSGALLLTVVFKLFDDTLRGEYLKEAFLASLRYTAIVNGAAFLVYVIGMLVVSPALTLCLGLALSIGSNGENVCAWTKRTLCYFLPPVAGRLWDHWNYHVGGDGIGALGLKMVFWIRIQKPALWKNNRVF